MMFNELNLSLKVEPAIDYTLDEINSFADELEGLKTLEDKLLHTKHTMPALYVAYL